MRETHDERLVSRTPIEIKAETSGPEWIDKIAEILGPPLFAIAPSEDSNYAVFTPNEPREMAMFNLYHIGSPDYSFTLKVIIARSTSVQEKPNFLVQLWFRTQNKGILEFSGEEYSDISKISVSSKEILLHPDGDESTDLNPCGSSLGN